MVHSSHSIKYVCNPISVQPWPNPVDVVIEYCSGQSAKRKNDTWWYYNYGFHMPKYIQNIEWTCNRGYWTLLGNIYWEYGNETWQYFNYAFRIASSS